MISKSLLSFFLILGFFSQSSLATNIEEIEEDNPGLGALQVIPPETWGTYANPHLPLNKGLGYDDNDSILTVSKPFYYLVTGYWPDEKGVVGRPFPNVIIIPPVSWEIRDFVRFCQSYTPEDIPSFHWRSLLDTLCTVQYLPNIFWPYLLRTNIHTVDLSFNKIGPKDMRAFGQCLPGTNVHTVILFGNRIGDQGARDFGQCLKGTNVHTVHLPVNEIGPEGARDFGQFLKETNVHTVVLSRNQIGNQGARDFGQFLKETNVHTVDLSDNEIDPVGALDFGRCLPGTNVHMVMLSWNFTNPETAQFLSETYPHITWRF